MPDATQFTPVEIMALSRCFKEKALDEARAAIAENSSQAFAFSVYLEGSVTRAGGTPPSVAAVPAHAPAVSLRTDAVLCAALRHLKIGPARLRAALEAVGDQPSVPTELLQVIGECEAALAASRPLIPEQQSPVSGRSGPISVSATVVKVLPREGAA